MIRVLLADDHPAIRAGVAKFIASEADMSVVGQIGDCSGVVALYREVAADVLVLDLHMPGMKGLETVRETSKAGMKVVIFSMFTEPSLAEEMRRAGACAMVSKEAELDVLVGTIRDAVASESVVVSPAPSRLLGLSLRERQVFEGIVQGKPLKVVAIDLGLSASTVHTYAGRIREKLGVEDTVDIARYADRHGITLALEQ